ncbi:type II toxin-antitoxin system RelE/ParE family toxin [Xenorhabdus sp. KK7.4]|uniref:type II toxin-antitoxin system RelE/ParE family toxin n=1 Tax=Xenorhabdus sp. KK7.4 TaxID=1851572 RepID=UPI000C0552CB|nr:type II toxin-antitoxin system RelE/ParE family toxin [Xenorhabdus sp. KK7.4]PHM52062.1 plasmid stabilization protein [Xenorhabdus sp. KK7.4]
MYRLSKQAAEDFAGIYDYTFRQFGEAQADQYTEALEEFFDTLARMPHIGREYDVVPDVMRIEFHKHTIFYKIRENDIFIVRILHQQMNHAHYFL